MIIFSLCFSQRYLAVNDKCRDAAAYLVSRFLTRPDVKLELLPGILDWMMRTLKEADSKTGFYPNIIVISPIVVYWDLR